LLLALAPVLLGTPGFGAGCLVLLFAAIRADPLSRRLRVTALLGAFALLFLLYYVPALMHEF
jgi:hypothetical protein